MRLWLEVNKVTKKKNWDNEKCYSCNCRFTCFGGNEIILDPIKMDIDGNHFSALFSVPFCLRIGLFKQLSNTWFTSSFKHGKVLDTEYGILQAIITLKPPTIRLIGRIY